MALPDFCWQLSITAESPSFVVDTFIPELYFDYFYVQQGAIRIASWARDKDDDLPRQALKTLLTQSLRLTLTLPLVVFGARLPLQWAEWYWEPQLPANEITAVDWLAREPADLDDFTRLVCDSIQGRAVRKNPYYLLPPELDETEWLRSYSTRHRRRLVRDTYGLSRKELLMLGNVHAFLVQACDFDGSQPHIIEYVNDEVFHDQPHLNRTFRRVTGMSPLEYFAAGSILQDNLMAVSYNENLHGKA